MTFRKLRIKKICLTCVKEFEILESQRIGKYCSTKCIRFSGSISDLKKHTGKGFWQTASEEEKIERLRLNFGRIVIKSDDCWGWKKKLLKSGYTTINMGRTKALLGHRLSWLIHNGPIPDKILVLHKCDNPSCTNPDHLFLGTQLDNVRDMEKKGRRVNKGMKVKYEQNYARNDGRT